MTVAAVQKRDRILVLGAVSVLAGISPDMLAHVHLQDCDGYADRHWPPGQGTIRWHSVFRALAAIEAKPHLVLELRKYADIPMAMAYLEREGLGQ